jgi:hypothetical protein
MLGRRCGWMWWIEKRRKKLEMECGVQVLV